MYRNFGSWLHFEFKNLIWPFNFTDSIVTLSFHIKERECFLKWLLGRYQDVVDKYFVSSAHINHDGILVQFLGFFVVYQPIYVSFRHCVVVLRSYFIFLSFIFAYVLCQYAILFFDCWHILVCIVIKKLGTILTAVPYLWWWYLLCLFLDSRNVMEFYATIIKVKGNAD